MTNLKGKRVRAFKLAHTG